MDTAGELEAILSMTLGLNQKIAGRKNVCI